MSLNDKLLQGAAAAGGITPSEHFGVVLYEGDGSASHSINGGKFGAAFYGNGSNSYINGTVSHGDDFSVSAWVYPNSHGYQVFYQARQDSANLIQVGQDTTGGNGTIAISNKVSNVWSNFYTTSEPLSTLNQWYHIVVNFTSSDAKIYVNGSFVESHNVYSSTPNYSTFNIGATNTTSYSGHWDGKIDQVRIFQRALTSSEVSTLYAETASTVESLDPLSEDTTDTLQVLGDSSCIATYRFENNEDDLSGNYDLTGNAIQYAAGRYGQAASFNGSSSYAQVGTSDIISGTTFSVSIWVIDEASSGYREFFSQQADNGKGIYIGRHTNSGTIRFNDLSISCTLGSNWNHLAFTVNGSTLKTYQNGTLINTSTSWAYLGSEAARNGSGVRIGRQFGTYSEYWLGKIDQLRIFNKELSASEVTTLYNENSLVASYRFEGNSNDDKRTFDGTDSNVTYEFGLNFTPDFVWAKRRSAAEDNAIFDTSRGVQKQITANKTNAESTKTNAISSFDLGGFTTGANNALNTDGEDYVAWCLKANGGTTSSNTDGSITSTVQANTDSGFSIVTYTGTGSTGTYGHGLSSAPDLIITKRTDAVEGWLVYSSSLSASNYMYLNGTGAAGTDTNAYKTISATTNQIGSDVTVNTSGGDYIAYCFNSVDSFSKFGSYIGNSSNDGPIVETGFEVGYLMIKNASDAGSWFIYDNKRNTSNPRINYVLSNASNVEASDMGGVDFLSNGFQIKEDHDDVNDDGDTYIYMAFAADPDTEAPAVAKSFTTVTYSGNETTRSINGLGFSPSLIWFKERTSTSNHVMFDVVRGVYNQLYITTSAESNNNATVSSFDSDGWSMNNGLAINENGQDYVAWAWKADDNEPTIFGGAAIAVYKFEDNANDVTGNFNGTANSITYATGNFNKAAVFNGSSSYVNLSNLGISGAAKVSVSAWINVDSLSSNQTIFQFGNEANKQRFGFAIDTNGSLYVEYYGRDVLTPTGVISTSTWYHVLVSYNGGSIETGSNTQIYVNGVAQTMSVSGSQTGSANLGDANYGIGYRRASSNQYFDGKIDQLRIYKGALEQVQVDELYAETVSDNDDLSLGGPPETIISANANAGFSIVKYDGTGVAGTKIPHGLSSAPELVITKRLNSAQNWAVFHTSIGPTKYLELNDTRAEDTATTVWNDTSPDATTVTFGTSSLGNGSGDDYIMYCFHSVSGFSDIGSYSGTGSSQTITTGFQPDWIVTKRTDTTDNWRMYDSVRQNTQPFDEILYPNLSNAEEDNTTFVTGTTSTGFTLGSGNGSNASGGTYIYMAFKIN